MFSWRRVARALLGRARRIWMFRQIASRMLPLDLLNCSRTSKAFRSALMSRSSRSVWITVLRSLPEFPPCPDDMSEPAYVALVFGEHCFVCTTISCPFSPSADSPERRHAPQARRTIWTTFSGSGFVMNAGTSSKWKQSSGSWLRLIAVVACVLVRNYWMIFQIKFATWS